MTFSHAAETEAPEHTPEQSLWRAVISEAVKEWLSGPLGRRREAEKYLFHDPSDFPLVCESAGMDAARLRIRLQALRTAKMSLVASPLAGLLRAVSAV